VLKTCYNNGQKERLCLIIDKCRRQKLCKRVQKILAAAPLRVMASRYNPGFITMLNKMLWSATGASKPMDQKSYIVYSFVILNSGF
jgi:hypothetical protein